MDLLRWLFKAQLPVAGSVLLLREVLGGFFGLLSALGGHAVTPTWASGRARLGLTAGLVLGTAALTLLFAAPGVPLLFSAGYQDTAFRCLFYGAFTITGFFVWAQARARAGQA
ncbi:hypothetical protein ACFQ36_22890, partial [Arthrobacter sp. GCM10027362]